MLRFTPFAVLNDPFEAKPKFSSTPVGVDRSDTLERIAGAMRSMDMSGYGVSPDERKRVEEEYLKEIGRMLDSQHEEYDANKDVHSRLLMDLNLGVLSLTEACDNILMWSHYANNHGGFVVGFDMGNDIFVDRNQKEALLGKPVAVNYTNDRVNMEPCLREDCHPPYRCNLQGEEALSCLRLTFSECITKSKDWEYEKEWRIIMENIVQYNENGVPGLRRIPSDAIKEVYIGLNTDANVRACASRFCLDNGLVLYEARQHETKFKLEFDPVKQGRQ